MTRIALARFIVGLGAASMLLPPAVAQTGGDIARGAALATRWCANCHVVSAGQRGPARDIAPPFATIAAKPEVTERYLQAFFTVPHTRMPDLSLTREEMSDLTGYILSLRKR
jgi:mono/diheme cytochrome c family protein